MGRDGLFKTAIDVTGGLLSAADALQPFTQMQIGGVVTFPVYIGIKQSPFSKIEFGGRGDRIDALARHIVIKWFSWLDSAILNLIAILF